MLIINAFSTVHCFKKRIWNQTHMTVIKHPIMSGSEWLKYVLEVKSFRWSFSSSKVSQNRAYYVVHGNPPEILKYFLLWGTRLTNLISLTDSINVSMMVLAMSILAGTIFRLHIYIHIYIYLKYFKWHYFSW